jgi:hypothetical protein
MEGNFFEPTILTNVPNNAAVAKEETFGPLAPLFRFKDEADVIAMSNDTEFGLASYFYARDLGRVFRVAEALEYGMVGVNTGLISNEVAPRAWAVKAPSTASKIIWKSNTSAWASNKPGKALLQAQRARERCPFARLQTGIFSVVGKAVAVDHRMLLQLPPHRLILEPRRPMSGE